MKVENMTYNAKTAFTERREIIDKLNECINSINTYGPEKIKDLETKNIQQDSDIVNLKTKIADIETKDTYQDSAIAIIETKNEKQDVDINNLKNADTNFTSKISAIETKNTQQDADINNLKNADTNNVKINKINEYAVGLTGNQNISGKKTFTSQIAMEKGNSSFFIDLKRTDIDRTATQNAYKDVAKIRIMDVNERTMFQVDSYVDLDDKRVLQLEVFNSDGTSSGYIHFICTGDGTKSIETNFPKPANWS